MTQPPLGVDQSSPRRPFSRWAPVMPRFRTSDNQHRVTTLELFFDLVFVFAFTQVTQFMAATHSAFGVAQGMLVLAILWWAWNSYAWIANQTYIDQGLLRGGMVVAMSAVFVLALAIPDAFAEDGRGVSGAGVFAICYAAIRLVHHVLYLIAAGEDTALRRQVLRTGVAMWISVVSIAVGAFVGGTLQFWIWLVGFSLDLAVTYVTSRNGDWRLHAPAHWAERFGLVVILALGESVVAIGVGARSATFDIPLIVGALVAIVIAVAFWWLHFDAVAIAAEHDLARREGRARAQLAIDGYTYLHLPIIAGVVLTALGVEDAIAHVSEAEAFGWFGAAALAGGAALFLVAEVAFWWRVGHTVKVFRLAGAVALAALVAPIAALPALAALALVAAVPAVVVVVELIRFGAVREQIRHPQTQH